MLPDVLGGRNAARCYNRHPFTRRIRQCVAYPPLSLNWRSKGGESAAAGRILLFLSQFISVPAYLHRWLQLACCRRECVSWIHR